MKLYILAFLVLTAAVTVAGNERIIVVPRVKELIKKNVRFHKRDSEECIAIECGKEGDKCTPKGTICQEGTNCRNGTCSQSIAGDPCSEDDDCYGLFYCSDNDDKCVPYQKAGDVCYGECEDMYDTLYCSSDTKGVCRPKHKEIGDVCDYNYERYCPSDVSYCTATSSSQTGVCKELPSKAGDSCDTNYGCNKENDLYCSKDTNKCTQLPKDGESCYNSKCSTGYYCNMNTCAKKKGLNEECTNGACDNELVCSEGKCRKRNPKRGEYCGTNVKCADKNDICEGNVCTDRKGRCTYDNDCKQ